MGREPVDPILGRDERGWPIFGYKVNEPSKGVPICNSRLGLDGVRGRCQRITRMRNGRCSVHGGKTPVGGASASFKTGEWSKHMPKLDLEVLKGAVSDPDYLRLREEMGLNFVHMTRLMSQFKKGTDEHTWDLIEEQATHLEDIVFKEDVVNFLRSMGGPGSNLESLANTAENLIRLIKNGRNERAIFNELAVVTESRRKLVETELKRVQLEQNNIPADQAFALFMRFIAMVKQIFGRDEVGMKAFAEMLEIMQSDIPSFGTLLEKNRRNKVEQFQNDVAEAGSNRALALEAEFSDISPEDEDVELLEESEPEMEENYEEENDDENFFDADPDLEYTVSFEFCLDEGLIN